MVSTDKAVLKWCRDGRWSPEIVGSDPGFARAIREGLRYQVIAWQVRVLCPEALEIISVAYNALRLTMHQLRNGSR